MQPFLAPTSFALLLASLAAACVSQQSDSSPKPAPKAAQAPPITDTAVRIARPYDAEQHERTCKVYHEIHAPDGRTLTKGEGGEFQHHRGLFVGWNKTRWHGQSFDFWHMNHGETQRFVAARPPRDLGLPDGAEVGEIVWQTKAGEVVVRELRGLTVARRHGVHHLHLRVRLEAADGPVELGGDPQHAGQQFRALQLFAEKDGPKVRYLRPVGAEKHDNDVWTGCAWIAQVMPLVDDEGRAAPVTVLRVEAAGNPGEATWSTRDYGRFGATRTLMLEPQKPLTLDFDYLIATGERDLAWCEQQVAALAQR